MDFFTVLRITVRILYVLLVLRQERRRVVHFNVTALHTAPWVAQQIVEASPENQTPRFLLRDRDAIYCLTFADHVGHMGIDEVLTAYRCPWQFPFVEGLIGSIHRECLDHLIVWNEDHLRRVLMAYFDNYHQARWHLSLEHNAPIPRAVELPSLGRVVSIPMVGGLHHRYRSAS